jgi:solute carrier family 50 (sugar transporter)
MGNDNSTGGGDTTKMIVLEYVCPALGTITANLMFAAPLRDVYVAVQAGRGLGDLNPTPWAFMLGNTVGWVTYGLMLRNPFVLLANAPGLLSSVWLNQQAAKLSSYPRGGGDVIADHHQAQSRSPLLVPQREQRRVDGDNGQAESVVTIANQEKQSTADDIAPLSLHDGLVLANVLLWMIVLVVLMFADVAAEQQRFVVGLVTNMLLVIFYAGPLSTIRTVMCRVKHTASIHIPTMITNTLNGVFWAAYGYAVSDPFISVPNSLGAGLGLVQVLLYVLYPRRATAATTTTASEPPDDHQVRAVDNAAAASATEP